MKSLNKISQSIIQLLIFKSVKQEKYTLVNNIWCLLWNFQEKFIKNWWKSWLVWTFLIKSLQLKKIQNFMINWDKKFYLCSAFKDTSKRKKMKEDSLKKRKKGSPLNKKMIKKIQLKIWILKRKSIQIQL